MIQKILINFYQITLVIVVWIRFCWICNVAGLCKFLAEDYVVIGIDLPSPESYWKICSINEGIFPVISADKKVEEYFQNIKIKNLYATYDPYVFSMADIIIVDINLAVQKQAEHIHTDEVVDYSVDISGLKLL